MKYLLSIVCLLFAIISFAQNHEYLLNPVDGFSKKKTSYITLNDGTELSGTIKKLKRKKGLFEEITLNTDSGKEKIKAEKISHMYLPQGGLDKLANAMDVMDNAQRWDGDNTINQEYIKDGYAYFESAEVQIKKKKTQTLLLQLLNPAFSNKVKVYHDVYAKESGGLGIGGIQMTGGRDKSYFFKKGNDVAFKLKKKQYGDQAASIYDDCKDYYETIKSDLKWARFEQQIYDYSQTCK